MDFVDPPPPSLGEIVYSWTNNGPNGPAPAPLAWRLLPVWLGALFGFIAGLIGFFVVGGILQSRGVHVEASGFLLALGGGTVGGALVGLPRAFRATKILTLYVGKSGCAQISGGQIHLLEFRDVESMRTHVSTMGKGAMRTSAREIYVRAHDGKERLWYVTAAEPKADDPQYAFGDAVLRAFADRQ
jgi:hypothetical protein